MEAIRGRDFLTFLTTTMDLMIRTILVDKNRYDRRAILLMEDEGGSWKLI